MGPEIAAFIGPVVSAVLAYLRHEGLKKAADKAAEEVGKEAMGGIVQAGRTAYTKLKQLLAAERDVKAAQSLENSAADPNDEDYAHKLQKELARLAASSVPAAEQLQAIAAEVRKSAPIHANLTFTNQAPNYGAQGQFFDRVEINPRKPGEHGEK